MYLQMDSDILTKKAIIFNFFRPKSGELTLPHIISIYLAS